MHVVWTVFVFLPFSNVFGITLKDFYPFGPAHGDFNAPTNDDGSTLPISIESHFPFFDHQHDSLIVSKYMMLQKYIKKCKYKLQQIGNTL